ncbi:GT2 family glycosyltransferase [Kineococcus radiotolerans]|uniref:GT2 family glycosyltransferase n=1 Tax=Kineococcus radiotolerans TaxID=131568 RepID=A0A7W4TMT4_KINRA|nr:glycosyltransferase [Kineococcus radiotolerans]MBB2901438.1 GT2 family glycosyltransferase [Kineococcus radiotolerans]
MSPLVSVVVPHYEDPHALDLVLTALELQDHPALEVVVADDGSATAPDPGPRPYPVRVVSQPDEGFRAAAARNLGAAAAGGDVLCFLDADTVPEPGYVSAVVRALAGADLVVGRRRHADLAALGPAGLVRWFRGGGPAPEEFEEPAWLREAYERTDDLRAAGDDAYRFVISAVLAVTRDLFDAVGGFEEGFTAYGGEDWEFAHRCWLAGAGFVHARDAVAWHDGPDFAGRTDEDAARRSRNGEGLTLARFVTDPAARGTGLVWEQPDVVVTLDDRGCDPADVVLSARSLLRGTDAGVWLRQGPSPVEDPRVHVGPPPAGVLGRCRFRVELDAPLVLEGADLRELTDVAPVRVDGLLVRRTRDLARGVPRDPAVFPGASAAPASGTDLQRLWGREDHRRRPRLQTSERTPFVVSERPIAAP